MPQSQQKMPPKQEPSTEQQNRKRKGRRKLSEGGGYSVESKDPLDAAGDSKFVAEKKPLHSSMEQLKMSQKPIVSRKAVGCNWQAVAKQTFQENKKHIENHSDAATLSKSARRRQKRLAAEDQYVAMDCEMVGVGLNGQYDMLGRVSIVSKRGVVLLDKFVKPQEAVTDYRTSVSGIRPHDINNAEDFKSVQDEVVQILQGKILVGHAIRKDLAVLHIKHPQANIRDTSNYKPLRRIVANGRTPSLKRLSQAILGMEIQTGEHNSVEDARATMSIYNALAGDWEAYIKRHNRK